MRPARRVWLERLSSEYWILPNACAKRCCREILRLRILNHCRRYRSSHPQTTGGPLAASGLQPGTRVGPYELFSTPRRRGHGKRCGWPGVPTDAFKREGGHFKLTEADAPASRSRAALCPRARHLGEPRASAYCRVSTMRGFLPKGCRTCRLEYVQGLPLTSWCDAHRPGISTRLELFLQVLDAVQYAHEKHVIHRDLKPSNILVTQSGQVQLLDFGVDQAPGR